MSTKEPKVNTFVTSTAVIKFSGGSMGTDEWTDSEDEDRTERETLDKKRVKSGQKTKDDQIQTPMSNHNHVAVAGYDDRTKKEMTKDGSEIIANGNGGVNHKGGGNPFFSQGDYAGDSSLRGKSISPPGLSQAQGKGSSAVRSKHKVTENNSYGDLSTSPFPEVEGSGRPEVVKNGVCRNRSSTDVPSDFGYEAKCNETNRTSPSLSNAADKSFEDRMGHSYETETDTDISLPLDDQNLAQITDEDLGLTENHFSQPEVLDSTDWDVFSLEGSAGFFGFSRVEELEMAIENCKEAVKLSQENSESRRKLVAKLVQLRLKLLQIKEGDEDEEREESKAVLGHKFHQMNRKSLNDHCEVCLSVIWTLLQKWYKCSECSFCCHRKCLNSVKRQCVSTKVARPCFDLHICPEKGLSPQNYRCAECRAPLAFNGSPSEPRLCDYSGLYYCSLCHWNDVEVIPARVIHNWDFEQKKVCRQSKQLLRLMYNRAFLRIQDLNPLLFNYVEELSQIKKLRGEILIMKVYFLSCRKAMESKLLKQLQNRPHFVENSDIYSLQDLIDTEEGSLLAELASIHGEFAVHIRIDCQLCQAKGFICEMCNSNEVLFPFDMIATVCDKCSAVFHRDCFYKRSGDCPKCARMSQRASTDRPPLSPARPIKK